MQEKLDLAQNPLIRASRNLGPLLSMRDYPKGITVIEDILQKAFGSDTHIKTY